MEKIAKYIIKPKFLFSYFLTIIALIFIVIYVAAKIIPDFRELISIIDQSIGFWWNIPILIVILLYLKKEYSATTYKVYTDRIDFENGFFNTNYISIKWKDVKEIHYNQGIVQKLFGIGTINFITAANSNSSSYTGIRFNNIQTPREIYAKMLEIHQSIIREKE